MHAEIKSAVDRTLRTLRVSLSPFSRSRSNYCLGNLHEFLRPITPLDEYSLAFVGALSRASERSRTTSDFVEYRGSTANGEG